MDIIKYAEKRRDEAVEPHDARYWAAYLDGATAHKRQFEVMGMKLIPSEQAFTVYLEVEDTLRLIFRDGQYAGWYNPMEGVK